MKRSRSSFAADAIPNGSSYFNGQRKAPGNAHYASHHHVLNTGHTASAMSSSSVIAGGNFSTNPRTSATGSGSAYIPASAAMGSDASDAAEKGASEFTGMTSAAQLEEEIKPRKSMISRPMKQDSFSNPSNHTRSFHGDNRAHNFSEIENFEVIKGPIQFQMICHYAWYGLMLILAHFAQWTYIWFWTFPMYVYSAYFVIQVSRIVLDRNVYSMAPLYLSFIPYFFFHIMAREAHMLFGVLWYISFMAIQLQICNPQLRLHVVLGSIGFLVIYITIVGAIDYIIRENSSYYQQYFVIFSQNITRDVMSCDTKNTNLYVVPINGSTMCQTYSSYKTVWEAEGTFFVSIVLLLQRFVQEYAFNLIDRQNFVARLSKQNQDLKTQLKSIKKEIDLDLDSPITKVIKSIRNIQDQCELDVDAMESLDYVVQLLSSNQLFMPNLNAGNKDNVDSDVKNWINSMVTNKADVAQNPEKPVLQGAGTNDAVLMKQVLSANEAQIRELLKTIDTWEFSLFDLVDLTEGRPLFFLAMEVFQQYNLKEHFKLDEGIMKSFLTIIEAGYHPNLYHNSIHAADVLQAVHYFFTTLNLKSILTIEDILAGVLAAIVHDLDHPGVNNAYMINSSSALAIRYNDQSVLENHHCARAWELMTTDPACNILGTLSPEKFKQVRSTMLSMVLATDMAGHFEFIAKFKNKLSGSGFQFEDPKDRQLLLDIAIKCGDISNATKSTELCKRWADLIMEEFFQQGDLEKKNGYPVSMFMDRTSTVIPKCQIGFIDYIVNPLYEVWDTFINEDHTYPALENLAKNREYWKKQHENK